MEHLPLCELLPEHLRRMIGDAATGIATDRRSAQEHLATGDPKQRSVALIALCHLWPVDDQYRDTCELIALLDKDSSVRTVALNCLGIAYAKTNDGRILEALARIVRNEAEDCRVRRQAYGALYSVCGVPVECRPDVMDLSIPQDIDWSFVSLVGGH